MARAIQVPDIAGAYIGGRQARQQEDYADTRNALARMEAEQMPQEIANRNALYQRQQQQYTQEQQIQALTGAKATAEHIAQHPQAKAFAAGNFPAFVQMAEQRTGRSWDSLSDQDVQAFAGDFAQQAAAKLGQSPAAPASFTLKPGETRFVGDKPVVTNPAKPAAADSGFTLSQGQTRFGPDGKPIASVSPAPNAYNQGAGSSDNVELAAQAIANYQQSPLGSMAMRSPYGQAVMARVMEINPDYQANEFGSRAKAYKEFTTGKNGNAVRSFNVAISHLDSLQHMADALGNSDIPAFNKLKNAWSRETGSAAPNTFDGMKKIVTDELVKAIVGAGGGVADREEAAATIAAANSPAQLAGIMDGYKELMAGQLGGLQQQYEQGTGRKDFKRFLSQKSIDYLDKHIGAAAPAAGGPAKITTDAEYDALPSGTKFIGPDNVTRRKP